MAVNLSPIWGAGAQLLDNSGNVLSGGKIYTYAAGTTTQVTTFTSNTGITANSNPIVLNSAGRVPYEIWLTDGQNYKFVLKDSNDVLIGTWDNLSGINSNFIAYTNQQEIQTATAGQTVFNLTTMNYLPATNSLSVFVDGVNQYGPGASYAYEETDSNTVTFTSGLHDGAEVKFTSSQIQNAGVADASQITYDPPFTNSVATNVELKLAQTVSVKDFGAVGDGVTDDSNAFLAFNAYLKSISDAGGAPTGNIIGNFLVNSTVEITASDAVIYCGGQIIAGSSFTTSDYLIDVVGSRVEIFNLNLECSSLASGINVSGGTIRVHNPVITHYKDIGVQLAGSSGDSKVYNPLITQWERGDPEFAVDANFTGIGIYFNRGDCEVRGGTTRWCGTCVEFGPSANTSWLTNHHPYNGRPSGDPGGPRVDPVIIKTAVGSSSTNIRNCYLDNGLINLYSPGVSLMDCSFLVNTNAVTFTGLSLINVYANGQTHPFQLQIQTPNNLALTGGYKFISYLSYGSNSWTGSYSSVAAYNAQNVETSTGIYTIINDNGNPVPTFTVVKPSGYIQYQHIIGTSTPILESYTSAGVYKIESEEFRVSPLTGTEPKLFFRDTQNGFVENGAGTITVQTGAVPKFEFVSNGVFRPVNDGTQNLGGPSNRWGTVYAATGTINTSDENEKTEIVDLSNAEKRVALILKSKMRRFKFKDAVAQKGDNARYHFGIIAQEVKAAFEAEGLVAEEYGVFCSDVLEDDSVRLGVRYDELLCFIMGAI